MFKRLVVLSVAALLAAPIANAEVSATFTGVSDYDFRGISQSAGDPALQASVDYSGDLVYLSAWASTIDFGDGVDGNVELDLVLGFTREYENSWRWDTGVTWYLYPGSNESETELESPDYWEIYAGGGWGPVDVKYWYSPDLYQSNETASYLEVNAGFDLPWELGLGVHAGYSFGDYFDALEDGAALDDEDYTGDDADYFDWSIGISRSFGNFDFELKYVDTVTDGSYWDVSSDALRNDNRVIFSVATTFPWGGDEE